MKTTLAICVLAVAIVTQLTDAQRCTYSCPRTSCSWWWRRRCTTYYTTCYCTHCKFGSYRVQSCEGCSRTCGGGKMTCTYKRDIITHATTGGKPCDKSTAVKKEIQSCNTQHCPIDGGWSDWSEYSECSAHCNKTRRRTCTNPPKRYGGKDCEGDDTEMENCYEGACLDAECQKAHAKKRTHHSLPRTCVNFVKCHPKGDGKTYHPTVHSCADGTVWMNHNQTCVHTNDVNNCQPCKDGDIISHESDCTKFYVCSNGGLLEMFCPDTTYFNPDKQFCEHDDGICKKPCKLGEYGPHESDCSKYYVCGHTGRTEMSCPGNTYFDPSINVCGHSKDVCKN